jgi:DNA-directed RNA polymerase specialized sigma24 family protein
MSHDAKDLRRLAYRTAARIVRNPVLAEEAGERAFHSLQLEMLAGRTPDQPMAWIRTVARNSACTILRNGWARTLPIEDALGVPAVAEPRSGSPSGEEVRALLGADLTRRQRDALEAALTCRTTSDAARACGMQPRDFRRYLARISARARQRLEAPLLRGLPGAGDGGAMLEQAGKRS